MINLSFFYIDVLIALTQLQKTTRAGSVVGKALILVHASVFDLFLY